MLGCREPSRGETGGVGARGVKIKITYYSGTEFTWPVRWVGIGTNEIRGEDGLIIATQYAPARGWSDPRGDHGAIYRIDVTDEE